MRKIRHSCRPRATYAGHFRGKRLWPWCGLILALPTVGGKEMMPRSNHRLVLAVFLSLASLAATAAPPVVSGCELFSRKNYWNTPVDTLQVHPSSATWVTSIGSATATHPDFGSVFGIPFTTA